MSDINTVTLTGRLGSDIELRYTPQGKAVCDINLAVQSGYGDNEKTSWIGLTMWDKKAEAAARYLGKGRKIAVSGRLDQETWEQDGNKRSKTRVVVHDWTFADSEKATPKQEPTTTRNVHDQVNASDQIPAGAAAGGDDIPF